MLVPPTFYSLKILSSKIFVYARTQWDLALYNAPVVLLDGLVSQIWKTQLCVILRRKLEIPDFSKIYFDVRYIYGTSYTRYMLYKVLSSRTCFFLLYIFGSGHSIASNIVPDPVDP
jgi:hypothetical protein